MNQLESANVSERVVAPHEVRELLRRLTEQSLEGIPATEARTLAGLSLESGIPLDRLQKALGEMRSSGGIRQSYWALGAISFLIVGGWTFWPHAQQPQAPVIMQPSAEVATKAPSFDTSGLVGINGVTFGPDSSNVKVDPSFIPPVPVPDGLSITAEAQGVMWGSGNHRALARQRILKSGELNAVKEDLTALLKYAREQAAKRGIPFTRNSPVGSVGAAANSKDGLIVSIGIYMYYGMGSGQVLLPPPGASRDAEATNAINKSVDEALDQIQNLLRFQHDAKRQSGPYGRKRRIFDHFFEFCKMFVVGDCVGKTMR